MAMILDATAGNRTMWITKNCDNIIYIDIERKLAKKPTIYCDNTNTPFLPETFDTIFYDPPHVWGRGDNPCPIYPSEIKKWLREHKPFAFTYYGWDKYKTKDALLNHLNKASKEFYRILKDDGLLWIKWNEVSMPLRTILIIFNDWYELLRLHVSDPSHTYGDAQTYWLCMAKRKPIGMQKKITEVLEEKETIELEFIDESEIEFEWEL